MCSPCGPNVIFLVFIYFFSCSNELQMHCSWSGWYFSECKWGRVWMRWSVEEARHWWRSESGGWAKAWFGTVPRGSLPSRPCSGTECQGTRCHQPGPGQAARWLNSKGWWPAPGAFHLLAQWTHKKSLWMGAGWLCSEAVRSPGITKAHFTLWLARNFLAKFQPNRYTLQILNI